MVSREKYLLLLTGRNDVPLGCVFFILTCLLFPLTGCGKTQAPVTAKGDERPVEIPLNSQVKALLAEAEDLKAKGRYAEAVTAYEKVVDARPDLAEPYVHLGALYFNLGITSKAEECYLKAVERDSKAPELFFHLGYIKESQGKPQEALEWYLKAEENGVASAELFFNIGNVFAGLQNPDRAIEYYNKAVAVNPKAVDAWVNLSILSFQKELYVDSEIYLNNAVALGYKAPEGYREAIAVKLQESHQTKKL
jgi:tetratricopeptide (TPR) repeat protein